MKQPTSYVKRPATDHGPIAMKGTLSVKWIAGRNGDFAVGDLATALGEFRVKDSLLDQFDEGVYTGTFWISQIFSKSYEYRGRITIETRAMLAELQIDDEGALCTTSTPPLDMDPVDEAPPPVPPAPPNVEKPLLKRQPEAIPKSATTKASQPDVDQVADRDLFGDELFEMVAARQPVKLDPTIGDRLRIRRQGARLGSLGYEFIARVQTWYVKGEYIQ